MIELRDVSHSYHGQHTVLEHVSLTIERGRMTAITGPSGRGKSTLLFIAGLLMRPDAGHVVIDGAEATHLGDLQSSALRGGGVSFVFQDAMLDSTRSVLDNVLESTDYSRQARRAARAYALELLAELGVDVDPLRRPGQISGGQAQRVAMCRALLPRPSAVLADEPTGNLDRVSAQAVLGRLRRAADDGAAVAIASHDERVIDACDVTYAL